LKLYWIAALLTCVYCVPMSRFHKEDTNEDSVVEWGRSVHMFVSVAKNGLMENKNFKECLWVHDSTREMCIFTYTCKGLLCGVGEGKWSVETVCSAGLQGLATFFGSRNLNKENTLCGMKLSGVKLKQDGAWTCSVEECQRGGCHLDGGNGNYVEHKAKLKVLKIASGMSMDPATVVIGSSLPVICRVNEVNPQPSISWKMNGQLFEGETEEIVDVNGDGTVSVSQTLMLLGNLAMDGSILECLAEVRNISKAGELVWVERVEQVIHVVPPTTEPPTTEVPTTQPPTTMTSSSEPPTTEPSSSEPPSTGTLLTTVPPGSTTTTPSTLSSPSILTSSVPPSYGPPTWSWSV